MNLPSLVRANMASFGLHGPSVPPRFGFLAFHLHRPVHEPSGLLYHVGADEKLNYVMGVSSRRVPG